MEMSKATIGTLATLCIVVGAGAGFLVTRNRPAPADAITESTVADQRSSAFTIAAEVPRAERLSDAADTPRSVSRDARASEVPQPPVPVAPAQHDVRTAPPVQVAVPSVTSPEPVPRLDALPNPAMTLSTGSLALPLLAPVRPSTAGPDSSVAARLSEFEEFVVSTDSVVGLQVETSTTSETARVEDEVVAHVTRDVWVRDRIVIPAGAVARGAVTLVERGGQLRSRARLGVRFTMVELVDGTRIPIETDMIYREGEARGTQSASRIGGGAIGGAIIGGILGGRRGAAIGGSAGAGAGTAAALAASPDPAVLPRGAAVTVRITAPTAVILPAD